MDNQPTTLPQQEPLQTLQSSSNLAWLKTLSIGFSLVSFGIAIGIVGYALTLNKNQPAPQNQEKVISPTTSQPSPTPDPTANWKTYTNTQNNFEFKYPENYINLNESHDYIPPYSLKTFITLVRKQGFQNTKAQYSQNANFAASTSSNVSKCYIDERNNKITEKQTINGVEYYITQISGAAAGNAVEKTIYRVIKNNTCFEISLAINSQTGSGEGLVDLMPQIQQDENNLKNELNEILSTFKFTQ